MIKTTGSQLYAQAIVNLIMLNGFLLGLVIAWLIFHLLSKPQKRPGINFKEFI